MKTLKDLEWVEMSILMDAKYMGTKPTIVRADNLRKSAMEDLNDEEIKRMNVADYIKKKFDLI